MAKIAIATVRSLINFLSSQPIDEAERVCRVDLLKQAGLTEQRLCHNNELLESSRYEALFHYGEKVLGLTNVGFEFGKTISPDRWGVLGYIAYTSPTLRFALTKQRKYQSLAGNLGTPITELINEKLTLKWIPAYQCSYHVVEEIITGWAALAANLSQNKIKASVIYFSHQYHGSNEDRKKYELFFCCQVNFNHDFNGIEICETALDIPLITQDALTNQTLCQQAELMLNNWVKESPIENVYQFIISQLPHGLPEIEEVAKQLGLSVRTLQRKLNENHITFTQMIDNIRQDLAISYLNNTNTKIIYITQMLGFSEQSAFQRAFKRWTGNTPKQFRDSR